jgi:ribonucleoside-diphosphate reductase alpha chain
MSFRTTFAENIYHNKYGKVFPKWEDLCACLVDEVCGTMHGTKEPLMSKEDRDQLTVYMQEKKFIPGGRYLYYAGRASHAYNNCYILIGEADTREEWGNVIRKASDCLMSGGGIGVDYSVFRPKGLVLSRTGGEASGPIPLMHSVNEYGRNVMQGGSRRSAIYASLNWQHGDADLFLKAKDWKSVLIGKAKKKDGSPYSVWDAKVEDFNYPAPLDMTNISLNYDNAFLTQLTQSGAPDRFRRNVLQALSTGEPGFSFNFFNKEKETGRNACCEITTEDDSDVCNLGSVNMATINSLQEMRDVSYLASQFLVCGTVRADLPYAKVYEVREKNRRLGLGLMGMHEFLLKNGMRYEVTPLLHQYLFNWMLNSQTGADAICKRLGISKPVAYRAIAPVGSIGILAGTTTGIEPMIYTAYKRRYLTNGTRWKYEYVVDATASYIIEQFGVDPESIETSASLALEPERRLKFQADVQDYVDMAISSTINLPPWGSEHNNEDKVEGFAAMLAKYAPRLRGFTCYPDGSRGGQPITEVPYKEAMAQTGKVFDELDICDITGKGGTCGG